MPVLGTSFCSLEVVILLSNTRKSVSYNFQTVRSGLKKRGAAKFF